MVNSNIFRVQIELGNYFSDHKAKAYVSVDQEWKNVRQFHRHIGKIFDVKKFVLLTSDGVYLPAKENIGIIRSGDVIHVIPKIDDTESVISAASEAVATLTDQNRSNVGENECAESVGTNDTSGTSSSKRKRVRHRKKKTPSIENNENQMNLPNVSPSTPVGGILKPNTTRVNIPKNNTHVRFDDDESASELDEEIILPKIARVIQANIKEIGIIKTNGHSEESAITEHIIENGSKSVPSNEQSLNMETTEIAESVPENPKSALESLAKDFEAISKYEDMKNNVKELDMIAFKVFLPSFEKSEYVIGLVESIIGKQNPEQQDYDLALIIMAGKSHIEHLTDTNEDDGEEKNKIQINRMDIYDAKILTL